MNKQKEITIAKQEKTIRNSSFELLRIIAMLFIIAHHFYVHGGFSDISPTNKALMTFFEFGGKFGVAIFVMISGYFLVNSKFKFKKLLKLVLQVWFYSVTFYLLFYFLGFYDFSSFQFVRRFFSITTKLNHFVTKYIVLYLLSPFINKMLHSLTQKQHLALIAVSLGLYTVLKYFISTSDFTIFFVLYFIGSYLKLHKIDLSKIKHKKLFLSLAILLAFAIVVLLKNFTKMNTYTERNLFMILLVTLVMLLFEQFEIKSKAINFIATTTFGIYLIHDNLSFSKILWKNIFANATFGQSPYLVLYGLAVVIIVFIGGAIIDLFRQYCLEKPLFKLIDKIKFKKLQKSNSKTDNPATALTQEQEIQENKENK